MGTDLRGLNVASELAQALAARGGPALALLVAVMSVWILFKVQLDILEATVRSVTDILWSASRRARALGDVRWVYYGVLVLVVGWGAVALTLTAPIVLLQIAANIAGLVMTLGALHILYVNRTLLPEPLRPSLHSSGGTRRHGALLRLFRLALASRRRRSGHRQGLSLPSAEWSRGLRVTGEWRPSRAIARPSIEGIESLEVSFQEGARTVFCAMDRRICLSTGHSPLRAREGLSSGARCHFDAAGPPLAGERRFSWRPATPGPCGGEPRDRTAC